MGFPSKEKIKKTLEKLEKVEGTLSLPENPTALEKFRWDLCQKFIVFKNNGNWPAFGCAKHFHFFMNFGLSPANSRRRASIG